MNGSSGSPIDAFVEEVALPSKGVLYEGKMPDGKVKIRPLTTAEEKILLGQGQDRLTLFDKALEQCLINLPIPYNELLIGDKLFLFFFLRGITWGFEYSPTFRCSECRKDFRHTLKVPDDLRIRQLNEADDKEPFTVVLPKCKKTVQLRLLRIYDEKEIEARVKEDIKRGLSGIGDPSYIHTLSMYIVSIDGQEASAIEAFNFCSHMHSMDSAAVRTEIEKHDCGGDFMLRLTCPHCGARIEQMLPFETDFFRPSPSRV